MTPLENQLRALRDAEAQVTPPTRLERAVLSAWDEAHHPRNAKASRSDRRAPSHPFPWIMWRGLTAAAAAVTLAFTLAVLGGRLRAGLGSTPPAQPGTETLMLVGEPILAGEPVRVVRMRVPTSTLAALGVRSLAGEFADAVDVDVIVGEDGVARAIRLGM